MNTGLATSLFPFHESIVYNMCVWYCDTGAVNSDVVDLTRRFTTMQQELNIDIHVEIVPFGTFQYRFTEANKENQDEHPQVSKGLALPPYYLPSGTGDLHGPVVIRSAAG